MRVLLAVGAAVCAGAVLTAWLFFGAGHAAVPDPAVPSPVRPAEAPDRLVVHEWGTFTSFSGSDGVPLSFYPNNNDLPGFVYYLDAPEGSKGGRLAQGGTVSMETPVLYFYTDRAVRASVRVDFPLGWITEWYPFAAAPPATRGRQARAPGQSIRWDVKLLNGETVRFPQEKEKNHYYEARATDSAPLQAEVVFPKDEGDGFLRGGKVTQREKFLFYRGVGTFPTPVTVRALGDGKVRVKNTAAGRVSGLVLVTIRNGRIGFRTLDALDAGKETMATLPRADGKTADLAKVLECELTAAGLYEKEARAMIRTWQSAWFGEEGTRLLYLVPRARTDELLPLAVDPKPAEVVRVLVGRHDFLTPEQEAVADSQLRKIQAAQAELQAADQELQKIGRFANEARQQAEKRLAAREQK
jgi:hypothetical protein